VPPYQSPRILPSMHVEAQARYKFLDGPIKKSASPSSSCAKHLEDKA
jgi:hypothetical protein